MRLRRSSMPATEVAQRWLIFAEGALGQICTKDDTDRIADMRQMQDARVQEFIAEQLSVGVRPPSKLMRDV